MPRENASAEPSAFPERNWSPGKRVANSLANASARKASVAEIPIRPYTNLSRKCDFRRFYCRAGVSPAIERLTLAGETPALHSEVPKPAAFGIRAKEQHRDFSRPAFLIRRRSSRLMKHFALEGAKRLGETLSRASCGGGGRRPCRRVWRLLRCQRLEGLRFCLGRCLCLR